MSSGPHKLKPPSYSVFFGNLGDKVTSQHLLELGTQAGPVKRASRTKEQLFGFVEYGDLESAIYCVGLYHGLLRLFGQPVHVNFSNHAADEVTPEAQQLLQRCTQLIDCLNSQQYSSAAAAGAVRRGGRDTQRYTPYGDARGHREQRAHTRAPSRWNDDSPTTDYGRETYPPQQYNYDQQAQYRPMFRQDVQQPQQQQQQSYGWFQQQHAAAAQPPAPAPHQPLDATAVAAMQAAAAAAAAAAGGLPAAAAPAAPPQASAGAWAQGQQQLQYGSAVGGAGGSRHAGTVQQAPQVQHSTVYQQDAYQAQSYHHQQQQQYHQGLQQQPQQQQHQQPVAQAYAGYTGYAQQQPQTHYQPPQQQWQQPQVQQQNYQAVSQYNTQPTAAAPQPPPQLPAAAHGFQSSMPHHVMQSQQAQYNQYHQQQQPQQHQQTYVWRQQ